MGIAIYSQRTSRRPTRRGAHELEVPPEGVSMQLVFPLEMFSAFVTHEMFCFGMPIHMHFQFVSSCEARAANVARTSSWH